MGNENGTDSRSGASTSLSASRRYFRSSCCRSGAPFRGTFGCSAARLLGSQSPSRSSRSPHFFLTPAPTLCYCYPYRTPPSILTQVLIRYLTHRSSPLSRTSSESFGASVSEPAMCWRTWVVFQAHRRKQNARHTLSLHHQPGSSRMFPLTARFDGYPRPSQRSYWSWPSSGSLRMPLLACTVQSSRTGSFSRAYPIVPLQRKNSGWAGYFSSFSGSGDVSMAPSEFSISSRWGQFMKASPRTTARYSPSSNNIPRHHGHRSGPQNHHIRSVCPK